MAYVTTERSLVHNVIMQISTNSRIQTKELKKRKKKKNYSTPRKTRQPKQDHRQTVTEQRNEA